MSSASEVNVQWPETGQPVLIKHYAGSVIMSNVAKVKRFAKDEVSSSTDAKGRLEDLIPFPSDQYSDEDDVYEDTQPIW